MIGAGAGTDPLRRRPARIKATLVVVAIAIPILLALTALLTVIVTTAIWPGEAALFEPVLCDETHPDAIVVADSSQSSEGTSYDFSVYCTSSDGDAINVGWARAWLLAWALHTALVLVALSLLALRWRRRRRTVSDHVGPLRG